MTRLIVLFLLFGAVCIYGFPKPESCGPNEEWRRCAVLPFCEPKCDQVFQKPCPLVCIDGCQCSEGYKRNVTTNLCVQCS